MIGAIVLAAGEATRFGAPKQLVLLGDVLARLEQSPVDEIVVVEGAYELEPRAALNVRIVHCLDWKRGPGASLRCGLAALSPEIEAAVIVLADGPDLGAEAVSRVIESWRLHGGNIVAASYGGERGHPLLIDRSAFADVPDEGLRARRPQLVPCDDLGAPGDVDTPGDLPERLR